MGVSKLQLLRPQLAHQLFVWPWQPHLTHPQSSVVAFMLQEHRAAVTGAIGGLRSKVYNIYYLAFMEKVAHPCFQWITSGNHSLNKDKEVVPDEERLIEICWFHHTVPRQIKRIHIWIGQPWALKYYSGIQVKSSWNKVPSFLCELTTMSQVTTTQLQ